MLAIRRDDFQHHLLTITEHEGVEEVRQRFGIVCPATPADDERRGAVGGEERNLRQIEHIQNIGVRQLEGEREADDVELREGVIGFQTVERNVRGAQLRLHVRPGGVNALGEHVGLAVQNVV